MADLTSIADVDGNPVAVLTDEVTDGTLGTGKKQLVGVVDATINGTNKLAVDSSGRAKVDASGVAVPVTDNGATLSIDDGGGSITVDGSLSFAAASAATAAVTSVAGSATAVTLLASNAARNLYEVFNDSTSALYVKHGSGASTTSFTVKLPAGASYFPPVNYTGIVTGIWDSAVGSARLTEY